MPGKSGGFLPGGGDRVDDLDSRPNCVGGIEHHRVKGSLYRAAWYQHVYASSGDDDGDTHLERDRLVSWQRG